MTARAGAYLDHNATAPLLAEARAAARAALDLAGNPSSVHAAGRAARALVEDAREAVAASVGAAPADVVLTSGATEANATALAGAGGRVLASAVEHDSVLAWAEGAGRVRVGADGRLDLDDLARRLAGGPPPALVAVMLANNETGVVQPVAEAARLARAAGVPLHCDAVQAWGRIPFDLAGLGAASVALSAHKAGGPKGAGALVLAPGAACPALLRGGGQERYRRAGTENVPGIAGFGAVARLGARPMAGTGALRRRLEEGVLRAAPATEVVARGSPRLPNTSMLALPGADSETLVIRLDLMGFAVGAGAACSSGKVGPSHVLAAMGRGPDEGAVRVSLGPATTAAEVDAFVAAWAEAAAGRAPRRRAA